MSLYGIDVPIYVTAYIKADNKAEALAVARALNYQEVLFLENGEVVVNGQEGLFNENTPYKDLVKYHPLSFSRVGTFNDCGDDAHVEFKCDDTGDDEADDPSELSSPTAADCIELAQAIFHGADGLTASEVSEGMNRALNATDWQTINDLRTEYFPDLEDEVETVSAETIAMLEESGYDVYDDGTTSHPFNARHDGADIGYANTEAEAWKICEEHYG